MQRFRLHLLLHLASVSFSSAFATRKYRSWQDLFSNVCLAPACHPPVPWNINIGFHVSDDRFKFSARRSARARYLPPRQSCLYKFFPVHDPGLFSKGNNKYGNGAVGVACAYFSPPPYDPEFPRSIMIHLTSGPQLFIQDILTPHSG